MMATNLEEREFILFVKQECRTCQMLEPLIRSFAARHAELTIFVQDDPGYLCDLGARYDETLEASFRAGIEITPTLIRREAGQEAGRAVGWDRGEWESLTGESWESPGIPAFQPGCGSKTREPGVYERLVARYGETGLSSRRIEIGEWDDPIETCFDRGWTDGLPVVPPTDERILRMLGGTSRRPDEVIGLMPPNLAPCTVEKVAINAVMAGCKPEYLPVVLAAVEAALDPLFTLHGLLCTTCFSSPIVIVNGPIAKTIGMNWGMNALGQGNRANATIGRALQLVVRNIGGGRPGELDRATLGGPGKYTFCFAEDETDRTWEPLAQSRGIVPGRSAVTLFQGEGILGVVDMKSRTPQQLVKSLAMSLLTVGHYKQAQYYDALLVVAPEHYKIFRDAGWDRRRITRELLAATTRPGHDLIAGAQGVGEGIAQHRSGEMVPKFWEDGLLIVRAGGEAGLYSAICGGWTGHRFHDESQPITREIRE